MFSLSRLEDNCCLGGCCHCFCNPELLGPIVVGDVPAGWLEREAA